MEEIHNCLQENKERGYANQRFTRRNPNGTYRLSASAGGDLIQINVFGDALTITGDIINALGWWESWDITPTRAEQLFRAANIKRNI